MEGLKQSLFTSKALDSVLSGTNGYLKSSAT